MPAVQLQHPRDNEPIPAGVPFAVAGLALGTGGAEQHLVETVTVAVDSGQPLAAKTKAVPKQPGRSGLTRPRLSQTRPRTALGPVSKVHRRAAGPRGATILRGRRVRGSCLWPRQPWH